LLASRGQTSARGQVKVVVRPERVRVEAPRKTGENRLPGRIERVVYAGPISQLVVTLDRGEHIQCMLANDGVDTTFERGTPVSVHLPCEALRVLRTDASESHEEGGLSPAVSARATTKS
jgi:ABC-type Fe3+/spermidine/putrescine transport system ATPase subunit